MRKEAVRFLVKHLDGRRLGDRDVALALRRFLDEMAGKGSALAAELSESIRTRSSARIGMADAVEMVEMAVREGVSLDFVWAGSSFPFPVYQKQMARMKKGMDARKKAKEAAEAEVMEEARKEVNDEGKIEGMLRDLAGDLSGAARVDGHDAGWFAAALDSLGLEALGEDAVGELRRLALQFVEKFTQPCSFRSACSALLSAGLADSARGGRGRDDGEFLDDDAGGGVRLSLRAASVLFADSPSLVRYDRISAYAGVIVPGEIEPRRLSYAPEADRQMANIGKVLSEEGYLRAREKIHAMGRRGVQLLLYGPPGTGKTESARQLALRSSRTVISLDASRLNGANWGDSEKAYKAVFDEYSYICAVSPQPPVLLLNEADSFLTRRVSVERSLDKAENAVSNIILEAFEKVDGIIIATTNNAEGIDSAFDRRFLFKVRLGHPDERARRAIWLDMVPDLTEEEAQALAGEYALTGAQIGNVAMKRSLAELFYDGDRGLDFIRGLCSEEADATARGGKQRKVGYR